MELCVKCKTELPDGAAFCPACGKKQAPEPRKHKKRANGTGSISKLPGKRSKPWLARRNGVAIGTYSTHHEAQKALERLTDRDVTDKFNLTFSQVYDLWQPEHDREISASQQGCYRSAYKNCTALHEKPFRTLRASDFQAVVTGLEDAGKSRSTCEKVVQLFGQMSKWAIQEGLITTNYAQFVSVRAKQKSTRVPFTSADIKALHGSKDPAAKIALILIGTGCRPGELFSVPLGLCYDSYFIGGSKTEAGKNRVIAVSPIGLAAYQELLTEARASKGTKLIDGYSGNHVASNFTKRDFHDLMESIGCAGMTPYNCRHTFATLAVKAGVKPALLKRMMGHADIATTDKIYTHLDAEDLLSEISKIDTTLTVYNKSVTRSAEQNKKNA